jgi:hypothetical protein
MAGDRRLTDKQQLFLDYLFGDCAGDVKEAMKKAGYSASYSERSLLTTLKEEILEGTVMHLTGLAPNAVLNLGKVLKDPSRAGNRDSINASKEILDRVGIVKIDKSEVNVKGDGAIFILPPKKPIETDEDAEESPTD